MFLHFVGHKNAFGVMVSESSYAMRTFFWLAILMVNTVRVMAVLLAVVLRTAVG